MATKPIARYMIVCDDWEIDSDNAQRINVFGLISNIRSLDEPPYPLLYRELCVFLALTEARGTGDAEIICTFEETGDRVFATTKRQIRFGKNPLDVVGVPFRIRGCTFPHAGLYTVQFWYNGELVEERPVRLR